MLKKETKEKITKNALSLEKYGSNEFAWNKENALNLIQSIMEDDIGIFGGDVYLLHQYGLEHSSDNWHCEPNNKDTKTEEYYKRSKKESLNYIKNYPIGNDENTIFSITFTEQII